MANEISWANLETDAGLAHYLSNEIHVDLYDPTDLRATMTRVDFRAGMGSETIKTTRVSAAHTFAAASTEISGGASNSDIGSGNFQLTVARRLQKWQASELWKMVAVNGSINLDLLRALIVGSTGQTVTDMVAALFPSLATSVGSTTGQMSVDYLFDGQFELNNNRARPPYTTVLYPHHWNRLQKSFRGEGGAIGFDPATREVIAARGPGYKGTFGGHDLWDADSVTLDGGSTYARSAMYADGCFAYTEAPVGDVADALPPNVRTIVDGIVRIVHSYDADNALTTIIGDYYPAVVEAEDLRGVLINAVDE